MPNEVWIEEVGDLFDALAPGFGTSFGTRSRSIMAVDVVEARVEVVLASLVSADGYCFFSCAA